MCMSILTMEINLLTVLAVNTQDDTQCQIEGSDLFYVCVCVRILIALQGSEIQFGYTNDDGEFLILA